MYPTVKRVLDYLLVILTAPITFPVMGILALLVKLTSPGPALFKQKRVGKNRTFFTIYKFRTMRADTPRDIPTHMLENPDAYITPVGAFYRRTSLDEVPQILNILKGDISVVGPRPALWNQDDLVAEREKYGANDILPGLTGWAQVNGRDDLPIPVKARYDGDYRRDMSFGLDAKIFFMTIVKVLRGSGVTEGVQNTAKRGGEGHG